MGILAVEFIAKTAAPVINPPLVPGLEGHLAEMQTVHIGNPVMLRQLGVDRRNPNE